jgi:hypothetical protein
MMGTAYKRYWQSNRRRASHTRSDTAVPFAFYTLARVQPLMLVRPKCDRQVKATNQVRLNARSRRTPTNANGTSPKEDRTRHLSDPVLLSIEDGVFSSALEMSAERWANAVP